METTISTPGAWTYFIGSYAYYLPFVLTSIWAPIALFDLSGKKDLSSSKIYLWALAILIVPIFGGGAYLLFGESGFDKKFRLTAVLGGLAVLLVVWILSILSQI
ncbi:PLDc N-terminal domain-containing protein [Leptospira ilyithenensis]|uniref:Phospholipase n=1 Tax=Leptospira ilyithenensis TaxID=2484901 RepID=A0A4R9LV08_9LEPT|nr:PLDc N-terminal domain-containing protein [Leptospira ilyithenensis]TGN13137.1 phospholipase [Leptospira ilyithenensis]